MLTISPEGNAQIVKATNPGTGWRGWKIKCHSIAEVHEVIDHYFRPDNAPKGHGTAKRKGCPLCRQEAERQKYHNETVRLKQERKKKRERNRQIMVGRVDQTLLPANISGIGRAVKHRSFGKNIRAAENFIEQIKQYDPDGVARGAYYIDVPEHLQKRAVVTKMLGG